LGFEGVAAEPGDLSQDDGPSVCAMEFPPIFNDSCPSLVQIIPNHFSVLSGLIISGSRRPVNLAGRASHLPMRIVGEREPRARAIIRKRSPLIIPYGN
jgi:hypothetical protein